MASGSSKRRVFLNPADCDQGFSIHSDGLQGSAPPLVSDFPSKPLADCWFGSRADVGIIRGKYCFGCKVVSFVDVRAKFTYPLHSDPYLREDFPLDEENLNVCRVGISKGDDVVGSLGDDTSHNLVYESTGNNFGPGDTIVCAVNLEDQQTMGAYVSFFKNGKSLGNTIKFNAQVESQDRKFPWDSAFFPHILLKNVEVKMQFSVEDGLVLPDGFESWASSLEDGNAIMGPQLDDPKNCEVILLVGMPHSGKSTWARKWVKEHPEKRYVLFGMDMALDLMKVRPDLRKLARGCCSIPYATSLIDRASLVLQALVLSFMEHVAPQNYIVDATNIDELERATYCEIFKMSRKIAVVVLPSYKDVEYRVRRTFAYHETVLCHVTMRDWLGEFTLPDKQKEPRIDEVRYVELQGPQAELLLFKMKKAQCAEEENSPYSSKEYLSLCFCSDLTRSCALIALDSGDDYHY